MKIHGLVYLVIGAIVVFFTMYVESRNEDAGMTFFLYVGYLFLAIGVFKILKGLLLREKKENNINKEIKFSDNYKKKIISCHVCSVRHYSNSNYCHMCGTKLRK